MIFLEKKKKKKKTQNYSAAEDVQVFGKRSWSKAYLSVVVVVVIEVNEREFFQRSSVYSWKCKCEGKGRTREHIFGDFKFFLFFLFFFTKRLDSLVKTPLFDHPSLRSHMRDYLPRFSTTTTTTTNNNNK